MDRPRLPRVELAAVALLAIIAGLTWLALLPWRSLAAPVITAALTATALVAVRALRGRPSALIDLAVSAIAYVVIAGLLLYRSTTFVGLPTMATVRAIGDGLVNGVARTLASSVPAPPTPAIRLVPFTVAWLAGFWGATLTIRSRSTLTPCLAAVAGFVFGFLMSGADDLAGLAGALVATVVLFVVVRVARLSDLDRRGTARRAVRFGVPAIVAITLVSVGGASVVTFTEPPYDMHDREPISIDARSALTPLRQIQARMSLPKPVTMFDVRVDAPATAIPNFRLSVLDQFDGSQWSSSEHFVEASSTLAPAPPTTAATQTITTDVTVHDLDGYWLPELATPIQVSLPLVDVGGQSQSLAIPARTVAGLHYSVQSVVSRPSVVQLQAAQPSVGDPSWVQLPPGPIGDVGTIKAAAAKAVAGATTPYAKLAALQTYLGSAPFRVTRDAPAGQSYARIAQFLTVDHAGTSEQFATAYALLARALGLPARVVAGFRHGPLKDGATTVTSADAYAWAEVSLADLGWVPFESTPGAGEPAPDAPTRPAVVVPPADEPSAVDPNAAPQSAAAPESSAATAGPDLMAIAGLVAGALLIVVLVVVPLIVVLVRARRTRARRRARAPRDRVLGAWRHALGVVRPPPDRALTTFTAAEVAGLVGVRFGDDLGTQMAGLGGLANRARFDPEHVADGDASAAWAAADSFRAATRRQLQLRTRVLTAVDPRTLRGT